MSERTPWQVLVDAAIALGVALEAEDRDHREIALASDNLRQAAKRYADADRAPGRPLGSRDAIPRKRRGAA